MIRAVKNEIKLMFRMGQGYTLEVLKGKPSNSLQPSMKQQACIDCNVQCIVFFSTELLAAFSLC